MNGCVKQDIIIQDKDTFFLFALDIFLIKYWTYYRKFYSFRFRLISNVHFHLTDTVTFL
jgi:hypothetical protein